MTEALDTSTDLYWLCLGLWMLVLALSGKGRDSGYFKWLLMAITGTLDTGNDLLMPERALDTSTDL